MNRLDRSSVVVVANAVRDLSDDEIDDLIASWSRTIGNDLALARLSMSAAERDALNWAAVALEKAARHRLRRRYGDPIDAEDFDAPNRLNELAQGHLVSTACADRVEPDRIERLGRVWRAIRKQNSST